MHLVLEQIPHPAVSINRWVGAHEKVFTAQQAVRNCKQAAAGTERVQPGLILSTRRCVSSQHNFGVSELRKNTEIQRVLALLNSRGLETTPDRVETWVSEIIERWARHYGEQLSVEKLVNALESGHKTLTICLHIRFGDAR